MRSARNLTVPRKANDLYAHRVAKRLTGISGPWGGLQWETVEGDKQVARRVINYLEDRRILFGDRHTEDQRHCLTSALQIREYLTKQINAANSGKTLEQTLKAMRAAFRKFVDAAGPDAVNFLEHRWPYQTDAFSLALGDLRGSVGMYIAMIAGKFSLKVDDELASILPPSDDDPSWLPGFE